MLANMSSPKLSMFSLTPNELSPGSAGGGGPFGFGGCAAMVGAGAGAGAGAGRGTGCETVRPFE
jgi:hypothetical protein